MGPITASICKNSPAGIAMECYNIISTAARTVNKSIVDVKEIESWETLKINTVPLLWYMGNGTKGLQKMLENFEVENNGVTIPTTVWWLPNPHTNRHRRQNSNIARSLVVFIVEGSKVAKSIVKKDIKAPAVRYRVKRYS